MPNVSPWCAWVISAVPRSAPAGPPEYHADCAGLVQKSFCCKKKAACPHVQAAKKGMLHIRSALQKHPGEIHCGRIDRSVLRREDFLVVVMAPLVVIQVAAIEFDFAHLRIDGVGTEMLFGGNEGFGPGVVEGDAVVVEPAQVEPFQLRIVRV